MPAKCISALIYCDLVYLTKCLFKKCQCWVEEVAKSLLASLRGIFLAVFCYVNYFKYAVCAF